MNTLEPQVPVSHLALRAARIACLFAASLVALKGIAFIQSGSVAMLSSLVDSMLDFLASGVNFIAIRYAMTPADDEHRFGHGKAEPLAALAQAAFIAGSGLFVLLESARRLTQDHAPLEHQMLGVGVMIFATVGTGILVVYQRRVAQQTGSLAITADSLHYLNDMLFNVSVICALLLAGQPAFWWVDIFIAGVISVYVLRSAWSISVRALDQLMDHELDTSMRARIHRTALKHPDVLGVHDLKTRAAGPLSFIQMHIELDGSLTLAQTHAITEQVEAAVLEVCPRAEVIIHQDPVNAAVPGA